MEPTGFDYHGPDHSGPSSRVALPSAHMTTEEVLKALGRHTEESRESDRQTATKLGVNRMALTAWLGGRDRPQRCMLARLAGFLRRVGYLYGADGLDFLPLYSPDLNTIACVWKLTRQLCLHNVYFPKLDQVMRNC
jgi:transcriptional regulator with XRE-family HTH domain